MDIAVIPQPAHVSPGEGTFQFDNSVRVVDRFSDPRSAFQLIHEIGAKTGLELQAGATAQRPVILEKSLHMPAESYQLKVEPSQVRLVAPDSAGLFYGIQTLVQLIGAEGKAPVVSIEDSPRYSWRGLHLDVCRHYMPVTEIQRLLDTMALLKMNVFHWHLTDDQGWRIEIKKYPRLTEVGAWREQTIGRPTKDAKGDGQPHGGYYTQDQVKQVVAYAAERHITVVPEIEMPGHAVAALAAYPNLSCTGGPFEVGQLWGVMEDIYCAGNEEVFEFNQNVLSEVLELFPSKFIHIGGDEAPKARWKECPKCQARIKEEGLKDEHELQSYVIRRIDKWLEAKGRRLIGWDEILEGGLAPGAAVMSWRGVEGGIAAASAGHDVVMTPTDFCYLDYYQSKQPGEPEAIGGYVPLDKVYSFEPTSETLDADAAKHVLGAQANLWTEYLSTPEAVEYMLFPRAIAMAEVMWSPKESRDFQDFERRLPSILAVLKKRQIQFRSRRVLEALYGAKLEYSGDANAARPLVCAFDGDANSQFQTAKPPTAGEALTITLPEPRKAQRVQVLTGPGRHWLRSGRIELDFGSGFEFCSKFESGAVDCSFPPKDVRAIRIIIDEDSPETLIIREVMLQ